MPTNGTLRALATLFAAVTLLVLVVGVVVAVIMGRPLNFEARVLMAVFLALHASAVTVAIGRSPWSDLDRVLEVIGRLGRSAPPTPPKE